MDASTSTPARADGEFERRWPLVLAAAAAVSVGSMGIGFYSLGLFVAPVQAEFGWSRGAAAGAATFQQLGIVLSAPLVGRLADRFGARRIAFASFLLTPLALLALSRTGGEVWQWWGLWLLVSAAGGGTNPAIWARAIAQAFDARRGLALGVMLMGSGLAAMLAPALLGPVIADHGWRAAPLAMAAATALVGLPACLALPRERPARQTAEPRGRFEVNRQTLTLAGVALALGFLVAALIVHLVPMLIDRGVAPAAAAKVAAAIGAAVLVSRLVVGWLFDRFHAPTVAALFLVSPVVASLMLWLGGPPILAALMLGLAAGAEVDMLAYFTGRYAARANYGATYGGILALFCLGAAFGPLALGRLYDRLGGYDEALAASAGLLALVVVAIARLGPYRTEASPRT